MIPRKLAVFLLIQLSWTSAFGGCPELASRYAKDQSALTTAELVKLQSCITNKIVEKVNSKDATEKDKESIHVAPAPAPAPVVVPADTMRMPGEPFIKRRY